MKQCRRSRLRSCRAESSAGALEATGGVCRRAPQARPSPTRNNWTRHRLRVRFTAVLVRLLKERRFDPPRLVEVERDGHWWPGFQRARRLCDDDRGWVADVEYVMRHEWGPSKHLEAVPAHRVRPSNGDTSP